MTSRAKAILIAKAAKSKKAEKVVVLDMRGACNFTDYFVITGGGSDRKVKAIADGIEEALGKKRIRPHHVEGYQEAAWIALDYSDVVAHVFYNEAREFYSLERLWSDAPKVKIKS